jgi:hypothetical protein
MIVLSSELALKLGELALLSHVWAVRTLATEQAAWRTWEEHSPQGTDPLTSGPTQVKGEILRMISCLSSS